MQKLNVKLEQGLLWVLLIYFCGFLLLFFWVNRTAMVMTLVPVIYIAYHYRLQRSIATIILFMPINLALVYALGGIDVLAQFNWNNYWFASIAFLGVTGVVHHAKKQLTISCIYPEQIPNLFGQVKLIRQIILNVLDNSLKHTEQGGVDIDLQLQFGVRHQVLLMLCFSDTGAGMSQEKRQQILERKGDYVREARTETGYGYGLKHSLWMLDQLNGHMLIDSEPDRGCKTTLEIPLLVDNHAISKISNFEIIHSQNLSH